MSTKPIFYMDIDGVLSLFGVSEGVEAEFVAIPGSRWEIILRKDRFDAVAALERVFEMRWASMWQADAPGTFAGVAGFGANWRYVEFTRHATSAAMVPGLGVVDYKIPGIVADAQGRPFVWADDDFEPHHDAWASRNRGRLIATDPRVGLSVRDAEDARLWGEVMA